MTMESPVRFVGDGEARMWPPAEAVAPSPGNLPVHDLEYLLKGNDFHRNMRDTAPNRSGSAPPSMEGSVAALGSFNSLHQSSFNNTLSGTNTEDNEPEEQLRADPSYIAYYLSNVNLNPRLPPPLKSRENRHLVQHVGHYGGNWRLASVKNNSKGYFLLPQSPLSTHKEEAEDDRSPTSVSSSSGEKSSGFLSHQHPSSEGRHNSFVKLIKEDFPQKASPVFGNHSQLSSHGLVEVAGSDVEVNPLQDASITASELPKLDLHTGNSSQVMHSAEQVGDSDLSVNSIRRISSSEGFLNQHVGPKKESNMGRRSSVSNVDGSHISKMVSEIKSLNISAEQRSQHSKQCFQKKNNSHLQANAIELHASQAHILPQSHTAYKSGNFMDQFSHVQSKLSPSADTRPELQQTEFSVPLFGGSTSYINPRNNHYPNLQPSSLFSPQYSIGSYPFNSSITPPVFASYPNPGAIPMALDNPFNLSIDGSGRNVAAGIDWQQMYKLYGQVGVPVQPTIMDPLYLNYIQQPSPDANVVTGLYDSMTHNFNLQKGLSVVLYPGEQLPSYLGSGTSIPDTMKAGVSGANYYGNPQNMGISIQYPPSSSGNPQLTGPSVVGTSLSIRRNDNTRLPVSSSRDTGSHSAWQGQKQRERVDDPKTFAFLEELKSSKTRRLVLSDIVGRIVEFSTDQHGSRFIQQKLENCTVEEKACVFREVLPHASTLMTDVFGNYVIQKFFEHGNAEQRKELASKLVGHIFPLSLQMYGCRVIQKALEVIDDEQKILLVRELDGHVMHCVRDQNGNHVIQKCIECVPTQRIGFIISAFQGQVAILSTHPYGCRVIQRVLEYCTDKSLIQSVVDEILQSACFLAQDQYGNYVTQHVLEKGKPQERSQIIKKLVGQIVQMSHNKFASNVIEKCLEYGDYVERDLLIEEILGQTEENENLLVMMKDQYANYVIQKILETCSDKQRENLLTRIKIHAEALKKYTYGKHIVARVEQLLDEENYASPV